MQTIEMSQQADSNKLLHVIIPVDEANRCYRLVIVMAPESEAVGNSPRASGWPAGFIEQTAGRWQGDFIKESEGAFEEREPL